MAALILRISRGSQRLLFSGKPAFPHRAIHTSVWWDMNSVQYPEDWDLSSIAGIAGNITDSLARVNCSAPVTFSAYVFYALFIGDEERNALSSTGIKLTDIYFSKYDPNLSSKQILHDIWFWTKDHPPPANCLFITDDGDLSFALHQLRMKGYHVLLAKTKELGEMEAAAKSVWRWESLLAGYAPDRTNIDYFSPTTT